MIEGFTAFKLVYYKLKGAWTISAKEKLCISVMYVLPEFSEKIWLPIKNRLRICWSTWQ